MMAVFGRFDNFRMSHLPMTTLRNALFGGWTNFVGTIWRRNGAGVTQTALVFGGVVPYTYEKNYGVMIYFCIRVSGGVAGGRLGLESSRVLV